MFQVLRLPHKWAAGLLAGLGCFHAHVALAQGPAPASPPVYLLAIEPGTLPTAAPAGASLPPSLPAGSGAPAGEVILSLPAGAPAPGAACGGQCPAPESPWAKVPSLSPQPLPGAFLVPPSGAGYYSAVDCLYGKCRETAPPTPYRTLFGSFYDNDFRYLDKGQDPVDCFDYLKRIRIGSTDCPWNHPWELSIGGEERIRYMNEEGGASGRLGDPNAGRGLRDDRYTLLRSRVYGDLWYKDFFRVYLEYIDAESFDRNLPPLAIDVGRSQFQNAFIDLKLMEINDRPVYARAGRQEMTYGSQRMVSPLDWANTRRTFDGAKVFYRSEQFDVDAFWTRPVLTTPVDFETDHVRQFAGAFATYRPNKDQAFDAYYFYLENDAPVAFGAAPGGRAGYDVNTVGGRWVGKHKASDLLPGLQGSDLNGQLLWEVEGAYQFGDYTSRLISAGMTTAGLGYAFTELPMQPQFWAYFDYASGSPNSTGTFSTYNQLFPFGHYYLGFADIVGRENIHDWNCQLSFYPTKWITCLAQYHVFRLDEARDALYTKTSGYVTERRDPTGRAGTDVGQELDLLANFQLDRHNSVLVGFSKFFSGEFIKATGPAVNPELFYVQYSFRW